MDLIHELDECAKRQLAFAPTYIQHSLEYLAAREIERNREAIAELVAVMHEARNVLSFLKPKTFGYGTLNRLDGAIAKHTRPTKKGSN